MKKVLSVMILAGFAVSCLLCGCGDKEQKPTADTSSAVSEETVTAVPTQTTTEISTETIVIDTATDEIPTELPSVDIHKTNSPTKMTLSSYTNSVSQGGEAFAEITAYPSAEYVATVLDKEKNSVDVQNVVSDEDGHINWQWDVPADFPTGSYTVNIQGDSKECSFTVGVVE